MHDDAAALAPGGLLPKISQGVTTVVTGNCGISLAPAPGGGSAPPVPPLDLLGGRETYAFPRFADFLEALRSRPADANVYPLVGHTVLRSRAMSELDRPATAREVAAMRDDLRQALSEGARGLSTGLAYPPARYATSDEVEALVSEVAAAAALWTTHMRDERTGVVASVAETIGTARSTGARTLISHHKCCGEAPRPFGHHPRDERGGAWRSGARPRRLSLHRKRHRADRGLRPRQPAGVGELVEPTPGGPPVPIFRRSRRSAASTR